MRRNFDEIVWKKELGEIKEKELPIEEKEID